MLSLQHKKLYLYEQGLEKNMRLNKDNLVVVGLLRI